MVPIAKVKSFINSGGHLASEALEMREGFLYIFTGPGDPERKSINMYTSISFSGYGVHPSPELRTTG